MALSTHAENENHEKIRGGYAKVSDNTNHIGQFKYNPSATPFSPLNHDTKQYAKDSILGKIREQREQREHRTAMTGNSFSTPESNMTGLLNDNKHHIDPVSFYNPWSKMDSDPQYSPGGQQFEFEEETQGSHDVFGLHSSNGSGGFAAFDCVSRVLDDDEQSVLDGTFSAGASFNSTSFNSNSFSATIRPPKSSVGVTGLAPSSLEDFPFERSPTGASSGLLWSSNGGDVTPSGKSDRNSDGYGSLERPSKHGDLLAWTDSCMRENSLIEESPIQVEVSNSFGVYKPFEFSKPRQFGQGDGLHNVPVKSSRSQDTQRMFEQDTDINHKLSLQQQQQQMYNQERSTFNNTKHSSYAANQAHLQSLLKAKLQASAASEVQQHNSPITTEFSSDTLSGLDKHLIAKALLAQGIPVNDSQLSPQQENGADSVHGEKERVDHSLGQQLHQMQQQKLASFMQPIRVVTQTPNSFGSGPQWSNPSTPNSLGEMANDMHGIDPTSNLRRQSLLAQQQQKLLAQKYSPHLNASQQSPGSLHPGLEKKFSALNTATMRAQQLFPRQRNTSEQSNESFQSSSSSERMNQQSIAEFNLERYGLLVPPKSQESAAETVTPSKASEAPYPLLPPHVMPQIPKFPPNMMPHLAHGELPEGLKFYPHLDPYTMARFQHPVFASGVPGDIAYDLAAGAPPFFPGIAPFFPAFKPPRRTGASNELHVRLEECYDQFKNLEKERKKTEAELARQNPGKKINSTNTVVIPRLPSSPSRVDRLVVDSLREHARVMTLIARMEKLRGEVLHSNIYSAMDMWMEGIRKVQARRKEEIFNATNRHRNGGARQQEEKGKDVLALAAAIGELTLHTRRARTAQWCALQSASRDVPAHCLHTAEAAAKNPRRVVTSVTGQSDKAFVQPLLSARTTMGPLRDASCDMVVRDPSQRANERDEGDQRSDTSTAAEPRED